jgi:hypothetical protein
MSALSTRSAVSNAVTFTPAVVVALTEPAVPDAVPLADSYSSKAFVVTRAVRYVLLSDPTCRVLICSKHEEVLRDIQKHLNATAGRDFDVMSFAEMAQKDYPSNPQLKGFREGGDPRPSEKHLSGSRPRHVNPLRVITLVMSSATGSTLVGANHVFLCESMPPELAKVERQCIKRIHRYGQTKVPARAHPLASDDQGVSVARRALQECIVHKFAFTGTVEERWALCDPALRQA